MIKGIIFVKVKTLNHDLTLRLSEVIYNKLKNYFEEKTREQLKLTRDLLQVKSDSIKNLMNSKIFELANFKDRNKSIINNRDQVKEIVLTGEISGLNGAYIEVLKSYEMADYKYLDQSNYFMLIDKPMAPLGLNFMKWKLEALKGGLLSLLFNFWFSVYGEVIQRCNGLIILFETMHKTFIIAEVAQAHDGSLGILHSYIDALKSTGVDAVKFQVHIAEAESSIYEPFRINFSYEDKTRYDYWQRMEFSEDQWTEIKKHCDEVDIEFMASPFSQKAVDLLERVGVKRYKIGSGEVSNYLMLEKICNTRKPIILSSGMSSYDELDAAVKFVEMHGNELSILQCTTSYPTPYDRLGLNVIHSGIERKISKP